ncbi:hypothetical protein MTO96_009492 [Rhipicephalus appendiculatus]
MRRPAHQAAGTQEPACPLRRCCKRGSNTFTRKPAACVIEPTLYNGAAAATILWGRVARGKARCLLASSALDAAVVVIGENAPIVAPTRAFAAASCGVEGNQVHDLARARVSRGLLFLDVRSERDHLRASESRGGRTLGSDHVGCLTATD